MTRRLLSAISLVLVALVCAAFVRANATPVELDVFAALIRPSAGQAVVGAFVAGWLVGTLGALRSVWRLGRERVQLRRALKLAEAEARTLRATAPAHAR
jgi:uncharacterized integral membrane protein